MFLLIVLAILATYTYASPILDSGRVVNGTDAQPGEIPYIVSLRSYNYHICGASILDETHVLTAGHCVEYEFTSRLTVQYGMTKIAYDGNAIQVADVVIHEDYSPANGYANDIAVLTLAEPLPLSDSVQPVVLPEQDEVPTIGDTSVLAGWGYPHTAGGLMEDLQRVDLVVYSDEDCSKEHGPQVSPKYHVCSGVPEGRKGQCRGDAGGTLVADGKQIGIVSWSVRPCALEGKPDVYCRVSSYIDWINKQRE